LVIEVNDLVALRADAWTNLQPAQVDHVEALPAKGAQVVLDRSAKLLGFLGRTER
jgi:hypothetical protein